MILINLAFCISKRSSTTTQKKKKEHLQAVPSCRTSDSQTSTWQLLLADGSSMTHDVLSFID
jgi:hypothetical protein